MGRGLDDPDLKLLRMVLASARDAVSEWGGDLYFVYLPEWQRFSEPSLASPYRSQVLLLVNDLGIPTIDVYRTMSAHRDPLALFPRRVHRHYNEEGYRLVAEAILRSIHD